MGKVPVEIGCSLIVRAVERTACGPPQRVGGVLLVLQDLPAVGIQGVDRTERIEPVQRLECVQAV